MGVSTTAIPVSDGSNPKASPRWRLPPWLWPTAATARDGGGATITDVSGNSGGHTTGKLIRLPNDGKQVESYHPITLPSKTVLCDIDLIRTAHTAAVLLNPLSAFEASLATTHGKVLPVDLRGYSRFALKGRVNTVTTAVASNPVLVPWLIDGVWDEENERFHSVRDIERADVDAYGDAGVTLTFDATPGTSDTATLVGPAASASGWYITNPEPDRTGYDTKGFPYLVVLRGTAIGALTGTGAIAHGLVRLTN
jgi:hypothetical protein